MDEQNEQRGENGYYREDKFEELLPVREDNEKTENRQSPPFEPSGETAEPIRRKRAQARDREEARGVREPREPKSRREDNGDRSRRRRQRNRQKKLMRMGIFLLLGLAIAIACFTFMKGAMTESTREPVLTGETVLVTIPEGASTKDIAEILKENNLIKNMFSFRLSSKMDGFDGTYKQGTYRIDTGLNKTQIMELLQSGEVSNDLKLTIPEGYNTQQIAERAESLGLFTKEEFIEACNTGTYEYDFVQNLPDRAYKLEGYLFPDTYFLSEGSTAEDLVNMMLTRFSQFYTDEFRAAVEKSGFSLDEIVTIASVIEKEIKVNEERPRAAGVVYNRLEEGMPLQMDATVLYAMGIVKEDISAVDLQFDSPYNTYQVSGLPLGPIASPGALSLAAAIQPEDNKYLYYVVEARGQDNHVYCETYDEFLAAKAKYKAS